VFRHGRHARRAEAEDERIAEAARLVDEAGRARSPPQPWPAPPTATLRNVLEA